MIAAFGRAALTLGVLTSVAAAVWWVQVGRTAASPAGRPARRADELSRLMTVGMLICAVAAVGMLEWALISHDFAVRYVADNGARAVSLYYTVISLWAALEGSLLLWLLVLTGLTVTVMRVGARTAGVLQPWAMAVLSAVAGFFFALAAFAGNPFQTVSPVPADGPGPNPLLQDHPLMGVHPPLLYLGYVGMAVPFAYAIAALVTGRTGSVWVAVTRRWTLAAWTALTVAIVMGGWWSYAVLGWGGYWAWDPVENAAIIPWFLATALLHSTQVQARRPTLRVWNLVLAMAAFLAVLVGTFLTRSDVLASVHAFTQSSVGPVLLGFVVATFLGCGALLVWRADRLGADDGLGGRLSREAVFLGNNLLLVALALTVLIGTVFPLVVEAVNGARLSVGAPYFNRMAIPLALALLLLMGIGPLVPWTYADPRLVAARLAWPAVAGLVVIGGLGLAGLHGTGALVTFGLAAFVLAGIAARVHGTWTASRPTRGRGRLRAAASGLARRRRFYGGMIVHIGVVLAAVAIAASSTYSQTTQRTLRPGDSLRLGAYTATLTGVSHHQTARRRWVAADIDLRQDGRSLGRHSPALSYYGAATQPVGTPAVDSGIGGDAYLVLVQVNPDNGTAVVSLSTHPMVGWLWTSAGVMAVGALLAGFPTRRRNSSLPPPEPRAAQPAEVMA